MNIVDLHIHPLVKVIKRFFNSYPNIFENIVGIYKDKASGIECYSCNKKQLHISELLIQWVIVQRKNMKNTAWDWVAPNTLPLFREVIQKDPNTIFDELKQTVCIIYHSSYCDKDKNDIVLLYPKFGKDSLFTTDEDFLLRNKKVFACSMEVAIKTMLSREYEIHRLMEDIEQNFKNARELWKYRKEEQYKHKEKELNVILKKLSKEYGIEVSLSEEAEQIAMEFKGGHQEIENELATAINVAINTISYPTESIELNDFLLSGIAKMNIEESKAASTIKLASATAANKEGTKGQRRKAETFLDRLEAAVKITHENGEKPTGKNVAVNMKPFKISAPAISDSISRYQKFIVELMSDEPSRWKLLHELFKPIQNILPEGGGT